jgi:hypothetical protein
VPHQQWWLRRWSDCWWPRVWWPLVTMMVEPVMRWPTATPTLMVGPVLRQLVATPAIMVRPAVRLQDRKPRISWPAWDCMSCPSSCTSPGTQVGRPFRSPFQPGTSVSWGRGLNGLWIQWLTYKCVEFKTSFQLANIKRFWVTRSFSSNVFLSAA